MGMGQGRDQGALNDRIAGVKALYSAEGVNNMAIRELMLGADEDGTMVAGTIASSGSQRTVGAAGGSAYTTRATSGSTITITTTGRYGTGNRRITTSMTSIAASFGSTRAFFNAASDARPIASVFDGATWSTPVYANSLGAQPTYVTAVPTVGGKSVVGVQDAGGKFHVGLISGAGGGTYTQVCADVYGTGSKVTDLCADPSTSRALVVWWDHPLLRYRYAVHDGFSLGGQGDVNISLGADIGETTRLFAKPSGGETLALLGTNARALHALFWNGSSWGAPATLNSDRSSIIYAGYGAAYEASAQRPVVAYSTMAGDLKARVYTGGAWSAETTISGVNTPMYFIQMVNKAGTNEVFLAGLDTAQRIWAAQWNGSSWSAATQLATGVGYNDRQAFDIQSMPDGSMVVMTFASGGANVNYRLWNGSSWGGPGVAAALNGQIQIMQLARGLTSMELHCFASTSSRRLYHTYWNGATVFTNMLSSTLSTDDALQRFHLIPGAASKSITQWAQISP